MQAPDPATEREIVVTRTFDAPRELVFEAFTDPRHVSQWWGPTGFSTETVHMDVRPGGTWQHVMRGPDGTAYPNFIRYQEVKRPERLSWAHGSAEGRRRLPATVTLPTSASAEQVTLASVPDEGGEDQTVEAAALRRGRTRRWRASRPCWTT
jgi:uncharacterized protein YndB with AHSA1/START domain